MVYKNTCLINTNVILNTFKFSNSIFLKLLQNMILNLEKHLSTLQDIFYTYLKHDTHSKDKSTIFSLFVFYVFVIYSTIFFFFLYSFTVFVTVYFIINIFYVYKQKNWFNCNSSNVYQIPINQRKISDVFSISES